MQVCNEKDTFVCLTIGRLWSDHDVIMMFWCAWRPTPGAVDTIAAECGHQGSLAAYDDAAAWLTGKCVAITIGSGRGVCNGYWEAARTMKAGWLSVRNELTGEVKMSGKLRLRSKDNPINYTLQLQKLCLIRCKNVH